MTFDPQVLCVTLQDQKSHENTSKEPLDHSDLSSPKFHQIYRIM